MMLYLCLRETQSSLGYTDFENRSVFALQCFRRTPCAASSFWGRVIEDYIKHDEL